MLKHIKADPLKLLHAKLHVNIIITFVCVFALGKVFYNSHMPYCIMVDVHMKCLYCFSSNFLYFFPHGFLQIILIGLDIYDTSQYMFLFENPILFAKYKPKAYCFFLIKTYKSSVVRTLRTKPNVYTTRFTV